MLKRKKCSLCLKTRNGSNVNIVASINLCRFCIEKDIKLEDYTCKFFDIKEEENKISSDSKTYVKDLNNLLNKRSRVVNSMMKHIEKNYDDERNRILKDIQKDVMRISENESKSHRELTNVDKILKDQPISSLKECSETLKKSESYADIQELNEIKKLKKGIGAPNPKDLYRALSQRVIGQDHAKKTISLAIAKHYCRLKNNKIKKSNILMMGPTGSGKTELVKVLAQEIDVPVAFIDASSLTAEGFQGGSVSSVIGSALMTASGNNKSLAEKSIIFIDEIDKKAGYNGGGQTEIRTINVQQELLKIMEGGSLSLGKDAPINTDQILFIAAGAFSGLEKFINKGNSNTIGFGEKSSFVSKGFSDVEIDHLLNYGLIPEFLGRFSAITYTEELNEKDLLDILSSKENSLVQQYKSIFSEYNCYINFSLSFLREVAEEAISQKIGARGLERIMESKMQELLFNIDDYIGKKIELLANQKIKVY